MKKILTSLLLNLFVFTTTHSLLSSASHVIYDSAGNKLLRGVPYYILPLLHGSGGGLTLSRSSKDACPFDVTQEPFELSHGVPFTINPIVLDEGFVRASYPTSIEADVVDPCRGSKIWKVSAAAKLDETISEQTVTIGGEFNTPGSCFQLVEDDVMPELRSYQIQHCPFKCGTNSTSSFTCYNIGLISSADGKTHLAPSGAIFPVVFTSSFGTLTQSATL